MIDPPERPAPPPCPRGQGEADAPADPEAVRTLLARARNFLETCRHDPRQALAQEDPAELLAALDDAQARASSAAFPAPLPTPGDEEVTDEEFPEGKAGVIRRLYPRRSA